MILKVNCKVVIFVIAWVSFCIGVYLYYLYSGPDRYAVSRRELQRYQDLYFKALKSSYLNEILTYDDKVYLLLKNFLLRLQLEDEVYYSEFVLSDRESVSSKLRSLASYNNDTLSHFLGEQFFSLYRMRMRNRLL